MNETLPPPLANSPKNCGLAIWSIMLGVLSLICLPAWSLVLGVFTLPCFYLLTAIPAVICGHMAMSRIKRAGGALCGNGLAIAGLVAGYLGTALSLVILPVLLATVIPNFAKARNVAMMNACNNHLRQIDGATQCWALENKKEAPDTPTQDDIKV